MSVSTEPPVSADAAPAPDRAATGRGRSRRPRWRRPALRLPRTTSAPAVLGVAAAAWAVAIGLVLAVVPMLVAWIASPATGLTWQEALRVAGTLWSVAQTAPVTVGAVTYTLLPWGLAVVSVLLVAHGGRWALRRCEPGRPAAVLVAAGVLAYAVLGAVIAFVSGSGLADVAPAGAALRAAGVAAIGMAVALGREGLLTDLPMPSWLMLAVRAGLAAVGVVVGIAAVVAAVALTANLDDAATMLTDLRTGLGGGLVMLVLGLGYVPVLVMWAVGYVLGAGVVLAPAVTVSPFIAVTPPTLLPPFPLLAAVPESASPLAWALPATGIVAGVVAGLLVGRAGRGEPRLVRVGIALLAAVVTGLVLAALTWLSSGSLGDLRLAQVGPSPLAVGVLALLAVAVGAAPASAIASPPRRPGLRVAPPDAPEPTLDVAPADEPADATRVDPPAEDVPGPVTPPAPSAQPPGDEQPASSDHGMPTPSPTPPTSA